MAIQGLYLYAPSVSHKLRKSTFNIDGVSKKDEGRKLSVLLFQHLWDTVCIQSPFCSVITAVEFHCVRGKILYPNKHVQVLWTLHQKVKKYL